MLANYLVKHRRKMIFRKQNLIIFLIGLTMIILTPGEAASKITYQLSFNEAQAHYVDVEMTLTGINQKYIDVKMPVWTPGSYLIREFSRHVEGFRATSAKSEEITSEKITKNTWRVYADKISDLKIKYRVYAFELTVRTSFVDLSHAYLNGTNIFMYVDDMQNTPAEIKIIPHKNWKKISTGLESKKDDPFTLYASNYDILADSPIEIGNQDIIEFTAVGIPHVIAMVGPGNYDREKIKSDFIKIVEETTKIIGKNPCKNYTFIVHNTLSGKGGLEHLNSTTVGVNRFAYSDESAYKKFLSLVAHEYFHIWNVKRLRPVPLGPFDYDNENYTHLLWVSEGFTAYYDNLILRRSGFYTPDKYLEIIANEITKQVNLPGDKIQSLSESSFDTWIKYYRRNENTDNTQVSYYDKGSIVANLINLEIIHQTKGEKSLDDVMRYMYETYYEKAARAFTDKEMKLAIEKIAGVNFDSFYAKYINDTSDIDYRTYFNYAGIRLVDQNKSKTEVSLGITTTVNNGRITITSVTAGTPAYIYGLNVNDEIIALDEYRVDDLAKMLATKKPNDKVIFLINRDGVILNLEVVLGKNENVKYKLERIEKPTSEQDVVYKKWLRINQ